MQLQDFLKYGLVVTFSSKLQILDIVKKMGEGGGVESLGQKLSIMSKVSYRKYI